MRIPRLIPDTIAVRFAVTVVLTAAVTAGLNLLFLSFGGVWGQPPVQETGLIQQASTILQLVEASPPGDRAALLAAIRDQGFTVAWYAPGSPAAKLLGSAARLPPDHERWVPEMLGRPARPHLVFNADSEIARSLGFGRDQHPQAFFLALGLGLNDNSWIVFTALRRSWGLQPRYQVAIKVVFLAVSILVVSCAATRFLARPIQRFADGVRRFGSDPKAPPLAEVGPRELRVVISAFNAMQEQVQRFVADRTEMLAAISHDLRTPLTRIRLRAELMEDVEQQRRLFRDVDDMQAMVESALAFFRDDLSGEEPTTFDLPELLRTIVDDYNDHGEPVTYDGPSLVACFGRPYALKRAIVNLVDNAVKYATPPNIDLECRQAEARIAVRDTGPGIPSDQHQNVFIPFLRLERSRNRKTGGVGLGLTAARSIIRAHGGEICLGNRSTGGLEALIVLPLYPS